MSLADDYSSDEDSFELFKAPARAAGQGAAAEQARMADRRLASREGRSFVDTHSKGMLGGLIVAGLIGASALAYRRFVLKQKTRSQACPTSPPRTGSRKRESRHDETGQDADSPSRSPSEAALHPARKQARLESGHWEKPHENGHQDVTSVDTKELDARPKHLPAEPAAKHSAASSSDVTGTAAAAEEQPPEADAPKTDREAIEQASHKTEETKRAEQIAEAERAAAAAKAKQEAEEQQAVAAAKARQEAGEKKAEAAAKAKKEAEEKQAAAAAKARQEAEKKRAAAAAKARQEAEEKQAEAAAKAKKEAEEKQAVAAAKARQEAEEKQAEAAAKAAKEAEERANPEADKGASKEAGDQQTPEVAARQENDMQKNKKQSESVAEQPDRDVEGFKTIQGADPAVGGARKSAEEREGDRRSSADGGSGDKDKSEDQPKDLDAVEAEVVKDILPPETQTLAEETQPLSNIDEGGSPSPDAEEPQASANSEGLGPKSRSRSLKGAGRSSSLKGQGSGSKIERKVSFMDGAVPGTDDSRTLGGAPAAEEGSPSGATDAAEAPEVPEQQSAGAATPTTFIADTDIVNVESGAPVTSTAIPSTAGPRDSSSEPKTDSSESVKKPAAKEGAKKSAAKEGVADVKSAGSASLGTQRAASQEVIASVAKQFGAKQFGAAPQAESFMSELDVLNEISAEYEEAGSRTPGQQGAEPQQQEQPQPGKAGEEEGRPEKPGRKARQAGEELAESTAAEQQEGKAAEPGQRETPRETPAEEGDREAQPPAKEEAESGRQENAKAQDSAEVQPVQSAFGAGSQE